MAGRVRRRRLQGVQVRVLQGHGRRQPSMRWKRTSARLCPQAPTRTAATSCRTPRKGRVVAKMYEQSIMRQIASGGHHQHERHGRPGRQRRSLRGLGVGAGRALGLRHAASRQVAHRGVRDVRDAQGLAAHPGRRRDRRRELARRQGGRQVRARRRHGFLDGHWASASRSAWPPTRPPQPRTPRAPGASSSTSRRARTATSIRRTSSTRSKTSKAR
jgi:hypothetical protein